MPMLFFSSISHSAIIVVLLLLLPLLCLLKDRRETPHRVCSNNNSICARVSLTVAAVHGAAALPAGYCCSGQR